MSAILRFSILLSSFVVASGCSDKDDTPSADTGGPSDTNNDEIADTGPGDTAAPEADESAYAGTYVGSISMALRYEDLGMDCTCNSLDDAITYVHSSELSVGQGECYSPDCNLDMDLFFLGNATEEDVFGVVSDQRDKVFNGISYFGSFDVKNGGSIQIMGDDEGIDGTMSVNATVSLVWASADTELK